MKSLILGLLAHVDAGKTTLSESLLYESGVLRRRGRVDNGDAFLDTYAVEKERGITVFSKQAVIKGESRDIVLMDTPGHVDFSAEMERTLQVIDGAVLVISGLDGLQAHTRTLWKLLEKYGIPALLFINKMDLPTAQKDELMREIRENFGEGCVDFTKREGGQFWEAVAVCQESALDMYLETGSVSDQLMRQMVKSRKLFPCYFGSALKQDGIREFLEGIQMYLEPPDYPKAFGARVYKIGRDGQGVRLTYLKVTGGKLSVKDTICWQTENGVTEEKINQLRLYSGAKYEVLQEAEAGSVVAVTGPEHTFIGQGLGKEEGRWLPVLEPVLSYQMFLEEGCDMGTAIQKLKQLGEEEPDLHIVWEEEEKQLQLKLMGEVQTEILQRRIQERFGMQVSFGPGNIVYKETIENTVEGVGHFEPLRHYAEVHLLLEPGEPGSGMQYTSTCSEDVLDRNWQRLILTHLGEREHKGVLTGSGLTDVKITLAAGKAHLKHTEGGDFRQAVYRAVRQGLMQARSVLLEPYYDFILEVPDTMTGRAMTDLERLHATSFQPEMEKGMAVIRGSGPVICLQSYQKEVIAYTKGMGRLTCTLKGYGRCHNTEEVLAGRGYDPERDVRNPSASVFCAHGAGFIVPWDEVKNHMHQPSVLERNRELSEEEIRSRAEAGSRRQPDLAIGTEEIDAILKKVSHANRKEESGRKRGFGRKKTTEVGKTYPSGESTAFQAGGKEAHTRVYRPPEKKQEYLLVDGYNIIFAWKELKELAETSLDGARGRLLDILCNYQGIRSCELIVVFDAYRLEGHREEAMDYHNIHVIYTKEAETADMFIERFAHENAGKYRVSVATSDGLEQIIIRGAGCELISARELEEEVRLVNERILQEYEVQNEKSRLYLSDVFPELD